MSAVPVLVRSRANEHKVERVATHDGRLFTMWMSVFLDETGRDEAKCDGYLLLTLQLHDAPLGPWSLVLAVARLLPLGRADVAQIEK